MIVSPTYKVSMTKCVGALNKYYCYNVKYQNNSYVSNSFIISFNIIYISLKLPILII